MSLPAYNRSRSRSRTYSDRSDEQVDVDFKDVFTLYDRKGISYTVYGKKTCTRTKFPNYYYHSTSIYIQQMASGHYCTVERKPFTQFTVFKFKCTIGKFHSARLPAGTDFL